MTPKISIITITYNAENWIERTVRSVLNQTCPDMEYIIVDGKSTDNTLGIIHQLIKEKNSNQKENNTAWVKIVSEPDGGIYDAMNKGLDLATGDYVWFMNAGDEIYESTTAEELIPFFEQNADVIYGDMMRVDVQRNTLGLAIHRPPKHFTWRSFRMGMTVCHQSILVSRKIAPKYDLQYRICADIDWVINTMKQAQIVCNSNRILSRFLIGGFSQQREKKAWHERFDIMKKHYGLAQALLFSSMIAIRYIRLRLFP